MQSFKSHKTVQAGKITDVRTEDYPDDQPGGLVFLTLDDGEVHQFDYQAPLFLRGPAMTGDYKGLVGSYLVKYSDDYVSLSPAAPFEEGYTRLTVPSTSDARTTNNVMRHAYKVLSDTEKVAMQAIKDQALALHDLIASLGSSRELSIAKTKAEEAAMWAVKHITA